MIVGRDLESGRSPWRREIYKNVSSVELGTTDLDSIKSLSIVSTNNCTIKTKNVLLQLLKNGFISHNHGYVLIKNLHEEFRTPNETCYGLFYAAPETFPDD